MILLPAVTDQLPFDKVYTIYGHTRLRVIYLDVYSIA